MRLLHPIQHFVLITVVIFITQSPLDAQDKKNITLYQFKRSENIIKPLLPERYPSISVSFVKLLVKKDEQIEHILFSHKVYPNDIDVYVLIYELNPKLHALKEFRKDTSLIVPIIKDSAKVLGPDDLIVIHLNDTLKSQIVELHKLIEKGAQQILSNPKKKSDSAFITSSIKSLSVITSAIVERSKPVSTVRLSVVKKMEEILLQYTKTQDSFSKTPKKKVLLSINDNLRDFANALIETKGAGEIPDNDDAYIKVSVMARKSSKLAEGYRIYYVPAGVYPHMPPESVEVIKPVPVDGAIPAGRWVIWAVHADILTPYPPGTIPWEGELKMGEHKNIHLIIPQDENKGYNRKGH